MVCVCVNIYIYKTSVLLLELYWCTHCSIPCLEHTDTLQFFSPPFMSQCDMCLGECACAKLIVQLWMCMLLPNLLLRTCIKYILAWKLFYAQDKLSFCHSPTQIKLITLNNNNVHLSCAYQRPVIIPKSTRSRSLEQMNHAINFLRQNDQTSASWHQAGSHWCFWPQNLCCCSAA